MKNKNKRTKEKQLTVTKKKKKCSRIQKYEKVCIFLLEDKKGTVDRSSTVIAKDAEGKYQQ